MFAFIPSPAFPSRFALQGVGVMHRGSARGCRRTNVRAAALTASVLHSGVICMANTPLYTLRLPAETQQGLVDVAKLCGYGSGREFAARVLRAAASGDLAQLDALRNEVAAPVGVQLPLTLSTSAARPRRPARSTQNQKNDERRRTRPRK